MKILHVTPYYAPAYPFGGVVRAVEGMARTLTQRGHDVTVLTTDIVSRKERYTGSFDEVVNGVRVVRVRNMIPYVRGRFNLSTPLSMRGAAERLMADADVLHIHEFRTAENLLTLPIAKRLNKPILLSPHGTLTHDSGEIGLKLAWDRLISPSMAKQFAGVIGLTNVETSEAQALWQQFGATNTKFFTVPNGVNADEFTDLREGAMFRAHYGLGDAPTVLFLGRIHKRKGAFELVDAFRHANMPDARLILAGPDDGELRMLQYMLTKQMIVTGYLDDRWRKAALGAADVFALPASGGEGLPMAALEALASGVPVILSPACNMPEVSAYNAGVITATDMKSLAEVIKDLLNDASRRKIMSDNARRLIREKFTWESVAKQFETIYQEFN